MKQHFNFIKRLDFSFIFITLLFFALSIVFIYSSQQTGQYGTDNFALKQVLNYVIGFILMFAVASLDIDQIKKLAWPFYGLTFASILLLRIAPQSIAHIVYGAKRWFTLPGIGSIQPSEFFKIALLIVVCSMVVKHTEENPVSSISSDLWLITKIMFAAIPPSLFVYQQPDTGMVFLYFCGIAAIIMISNVSRKLIFSLSIVPALVSSALMFIYFEMPDFFFKHLVTLLKPHQQERILGWLSPFQYTDEGYQTKQALLAVGSGALKGKGIGHGNVYIPEKHTDFIFSTIAEEGGFIIASLTILLFLILLYRIIITAHRSDNLFGTLFCSGTVAVLAVQIFQNIGMIVGLMPVKGISLPFLTYGGSSLFSNMMLLGIILSIGKTYRKYMFTID
ncbi:FtsW/RodA/SpoVE family cell cycle protein [Microbacteriaceae bacterium 4G12]